MKIEKWWEALYRGFTCERFAFELAFAKSIWKAQGQTLGKTVVVSDKPVNKAPFDFNMLYTSISRVKLKRNLRLFSYENDLTLKYIKGLRRDEHLTMFLKERKRSTRFE